MRQPATIFGPESVRKYFVIPTLICCLMMAFPQVVTGAPEPESRSTSTRSPALSGLRLVAKLPVVEVQQQSGDFESWGNEITVNSKQMLFFRWHAGQSKLTAAEWRLTDALPRPNAKVLKSGSAGPAPDQSKVTFFRVDLSQALPSTASPGSSYWLTVKGVGADTSESLAVKINYAKPNIATVFRRSAVFPSMEVVAFHEKFGQSALTQLYYAGADLQLRVFNASKKKTAPVVLNVVDDSLLYRAREQVSIPSLGPGEWKFLHVALDAILPHSRSQTRQADTLRQWQRQRRERCGAALKAVMDWQGPAGDAPVNAHEEAFLADAGWTDYAATAPGTPICDANTCVDVCNIEKNIQAELDGKVVGYSYFVGLFPKFGEYGKARTAADGGELAFRPDTKITVASVSKLVTAIAAVRVLDQNGVSLDDAIGPYLPNDWDVDPYFENLTFSQLLRHRTGIKDYGNIPMDYATVKRFFEQTVDPSSTSGCMGPAVKNPPNPVNTNDMSGCYSNYNFAVFRILLPSVAGLPANNNAATRPGTLARQFEELVQNNIFDPVGRRAVGCRPPADGNHAFAYQFPGDKPGKDWGDVSLECGAAGFYLSVKDMTKVLLSLVNKDGKIFVETGGKQQFDDLRTRGLGMERDSNSTTHEYEMIKNGGWADCNDERCANITTAAGIFGPKIGPKLVGVLFINSDIDGAANRRADQVLRQAYKNALRPK